MVTEDDPTPLVVETPVVLEKVVVGVELREPMPEELEPLVDTVLLPAVEVELELPISVVVTVIVEVVPMLCEPVEVVLTPLLVVLLP